MDTNSRIRSKQWKYKRYSQYESELRATAASWFKLKGFHTNTKYPFILKKSDDWHNNILLDDVYNYILRQIAERKLLRKPFPLHKYIHHGLSSQAMLFNLVGPMIVGSDISPLLSLIGKKGIALKSKNYTAELEYCHRKTFNEDFGQPTSIDLIIKDDSDNPLIIFESKFVEKEFGGCSVYKDGDCDGQNPASDLSGCYLNFIGRTYWDSLKDYGFLDTPIGSDSNCALINNYQYFRELLFALKQGGTFILLYDERNPTFFNTDGMTPRGLMPYLKKLTPEKYHDRIAHISIQELVEEISLYGKHEWVNEFKVKYGL